MRKFSLVQPDNFVENKPGKRRKPQSRCMSVVRAPRSEMTLIEFVTIGTFVLA